MSVLPPKLLLRLRLCSERGPEEGPEGFEEEAVWHEVVGEFVVSIFIKRKLSRLYPFMASLDLALFFSSIAMVS